MFNHRPYRILSFLLIFHLFFLVSCHQDILERIDSLQSQIDALKSAQAAYENKLFVTNVIAIEDGYRVVFSDGTFSIIDSGQKYIEVNNSEVFITSISIGEMAVTFVLSDGQSFEIPLYAALSISFDGLEQVIVESDSEIEIKYSVYSRLTPVKVEALASSGIQVAVLSDENKLRIKISGTVDEYSKVVVFASNGEKITMQTLHFEQASLYVNPSDVLYFPAEGGTFDLTILTNLGFETYVPEDCSSWLSFTRTRSIEKFHGTVTVSANTTYDDRQSVLTILGEGTSIAAQIQIIQAANTGFQLISDKVIAMKEGGVFSIPVLANMDYSLSIPSSYASWITQVRSRGLSESSIVLSIAPNESDELKTAELSLMAGTQSAPLYVRQFGNSRSIYIEHANQTMVAPFINGEETDYPKFIVIDWGDDHLEEYVQDLTHTYDTDNVHLMEIRCATDVFPIVEIQSLAGIKSIDLSAL